MPFAPRPPCSVSTCPNRKPCPVHGDPAAKAYDRARGKTATRQYGGRHRKLRKQTLSRDPLCVCSVYPGCTHAPGDCGELSVIDDHVVPIRDAPERAFDPSNRQGLCIPCHNRKTAQETRATRAG